MRRPAAPCGGSDCRTPDRLDPAFGAGLRPDVADVADVADSATSKAAIPLPVLIVLAAGCGGGHNAKAQGGNAARGKLLYVSRTCDGCHSLNGVRGTGPTWKGLAGSRVKLEGGKTVTADDAYLLESIETPNKEIVSTYAPLMTSVIKPHSVSNRDARDLIAFIKTVR